MKHLLFLSLSLIILGLGCTRKDMRQAEILYELRFPNAQHNEAEITVSVSGLNDAPVRFAMSRTSPGRYALHEFAKNVYDIRAVGGTGDTLEVFRPDLHNWVVSGHDGRVSFSYTLYADHADGTYSGINEQHAHLNIPASLVWVKGLEDQPVTVRFYPPKGAGWKLATQLVPTPDPHTFTAPDVAYLMDSPTELSDFSLREWRVELDPQRPLIRLAIHHNGTEADVDRYAELAAKVVEEQIAVFGEAPAYDYDTYTFIADYLPYVYGDGMEHRNSTILTSTQALSDSSMRNLYTLSHEYFHGWNVERIRPESLEPFQFQQANISGALWFAEGFTSYYDDLTVRRAGIIDDNEYAEGWSGTLNYVLNSPGRKFYSTVGMSMQAPFVDAASSIDAQNKDNTFISYYSWGAVLGLGLDLMLRSEFDQVNLDDYMRAMWRKYGKSEQPYRLEDLQETLAEVTGNPGFADQFFSSYVYGNDMIDLEPLLAKAGFLLQKELPGQAVISFGEARVDYEAERPVVAENTIMGSPLYEAGIDRGDVLLSLDGARIRSARDVQRVLASYDPGDAVAVQYESLGVVTDTTLTLAENPTLQLVSFEQVGRGITEEIKTFRQNWLGSKTGAY